MATPNTKATAEKQNRGNRRSGAVRGTKSGLRRGTLPWRKDLVIGERVDLVRTLKAQGYTAAPMLGPVNELMRRRGVPEITLDTIYDDFARVRELLAEERASAAGIEGEARDRHFEALEEVKRQAWRAFHQTKDASLNRSAYLNTIRAVTETEAKLDGSYIERKEVNGNNPITIQYVTPDDLPPTPESPPST